MRTEEERRNLRKRIGELAEGGPGWWHVIDFGDGVKTEGNSAESKEPLYILNRLDREGLIPGDMRGVRVLDVGAFSGGYSAEFARRGAAVTAIDHWEYAFKQLAFVNEQLGLGIDCRFLDIDHISEKELGRFDIVFCLGVIYHSMHPMLILERVAGVCDDMLVLESMVHKQEAFSEWMKFIERDSGMHDESNWWLPGVDALRGMMRTVGFDLTRVVEHPLSDRAIVAGWKKGRLSDGKLSLLCESRNISVLWSEKKITTGRHLYTSYTSQTGFKEFERTPGARASSTDRRLFQKVEMPARGRMTVEKDYFYWDMIERWEITLTSESEIVFEVSVECEHPLDLTEVGISFTLAGEYDHWKVGSCEEQALHSTSGVTEPLKGSPGQGPQRVSLESSPGDLPDLLIESYGGILCGGNTYVTYRRDKHGGRVLQLARKIEGMETGRHLIFKGRLRTKASL